MTVTGLELEIDQSLDDDRFRAQVREWIGRHAPAGLANMVDWSQILLGNWWNFLEERRSPQYVAWEAAMLAERLICGHWPVRYGGRELTDAQAAIVDQECLRAGVPRIFRDQGEAWLGSALLAWGTEEQKDHYLPRIVSGEHSWCTGFSEPGHGSDLAALETRGVIEGDTITITGQKTWTTYGQYANMLFLLCRTDPDASPRHRGITFVIVDKAQADPRNLEFRPIRQISGDDEFTETFIDGLTVPIGNIVGGVGNGWRVAMTTLGVERSGRAHAARNAVFAEKFRDLVRLADELGRTTDPEVRRGFLDLYTDLQAMLFWSGGTGVVVHESVERLVATAWKQKLGHLAMTVLGERGAIRPAGTGPTYEGADYRLNPWQFGHLASLAGSIASGSSEIQRNIVAERVLGMPREPRP